jgi:hypothetical protein
MAYPALNRREHTVLILRVKDHLNARMIPIARGQFVAAKPRHQHHPIAERQGAGKGAIENRSLAPRHHHFPFAHPAGEPGGQHNALFIHFFAHRHPPPEAEYNAAVGWRRRRAAIRISAPL